MPEAGSSERGPTPHDALFRHVFSQPEHAGAELRHVLPASIVAAIDWHSLRAVPGSWIDGELRTTHADLLCSVRLAGREALVYLLLEHKSGLDPMTPFQLLRYMLRIWQAYRREHPGIRVLPVVFPVVVHHGEAPWSAPTDLLHLFDLPPELRDDLAEFVLKSRAAARRTTRASAASIRIRRFGSLARSGTGGPVPPAPPLRIGRSSSATDAKRRGRRDGLRSSMAGRPVAR